VVLGLSTAWYDQVPPEQAEDLISRALRAGAEGVALQCLPYWWQQEYQQFRRSYLPRSEGWAPLWDYDATLKRLFRHPQAAGAAPDRPAYIWPRLRPAAGDS
jgi:hypothetical protein